MEGLLCSVRLCVSRVAESRECSSGSFVVHALRVGVRNGAEWVSAGDRVPVPVGGDDRQLLEDVIRQLLLALPSGPPTRHPRPSDRRGMSAPLEFSECGQKAGKNASCMI